MTGLSESEQFVLDYSFKASSKPIKMSFHTITMMVRWAVTANKERSNLLDELRKIPKSEREKDHRILELVRNLKTQWQQGTQIERLAVCGWIEHESISLFCNMLDILPELRTQYKEEERKYGAPPELDNTQLEEYEKASNNARKSFQN